MRISKAPNFFLFVMTMREWAAWSRIIFGQMSIFSKNETKSKLANWDEWQMSIYWPGLATNSNIAHPKCVQNWLLPNHLLNFSVSITVLLSKRTKRSNIITLILDKYSSRGTQNHFHLEEAITTAVHRSNSNRKL